MAHLNSSNDQNKLKKEIEFLDNQYKVDKEILKNNTYSNLDLGWFQQKKLLFIKKYQELLSEL